MRLFWRGKLCVIPRSGRKPPRLFQSQLLDRGIQMRRGNMRSHFVKRSELFFERSKNGERAMIARRRRMTMFHGQIPRCPISGC
jgi:hypothetical protein